MGRQAPPTPPRHCRRDTPGYPAASFRRQAHTPKVRQPIQWAELTTELSFKNDKKAELNRIHRRTMKLLDRSPELEYLRAREIVVNGSQHPQPVQDSRLANPIREIEYEGASVQTSQDATSFTTLPDPTQSADFKLATLNSIRSATASHPVVGVITCHKGTHIDE
ncbi:unnamed protein product [Peniophora sp. CBMAI 1063]|nr:unnamed protein product [Peniophora sp. CBMAI 1063]